MSRKKIQEKKKKRLKDKIADILDYSSFFYIYAFAWRMFCFSFLVEYLLFWNGLGHLRYVYE